MSSFERKLEQNFVRWCKEKDIIPIKGPTQNTKGFPDRFFQLPNHGGTLYVEFKGSNNYGLSPMQQWWATYLKQSSPHRYFVVDTLETLERLKRACETFIRLGPDLYEAEMTIIKNYLSRNA